ncbi:glycosyltransferase family 2 protein [Methanoculleus bourgensis]|uniref:Glycosyltransferase 2-like domain-containing protein n=1 Tax=Methanoculleus bourgensis TaxID=83986 RepID=A0A0X3BPA2_9EURY|nr:protein of unknown function [Methanoculleus bourgensis]
MTTRTRTPSTPTRQADRVVEHGGNGGDAHLLVDDLTGRARPRRPVRTLVAMPAYNEEAYIAKTVLGAARHADAVLVVDDGSTDDTVPIAEALGAMVIRHTTNKGYGGALQTIFSAARDLGAEELVIIDARHDPAEIPRLLTELRKGNDVVLPAADPESGFGAYGKRAIEAVLAGGTFDAGVLVADPGLKVAGVQPGSPAAGTPLPGEADRRGGPGVQRGRVDRGGARRHPRLRRESLRGERRLLRPDRGDHRRLRPARSADRPHPPQPEPGGRGGDHLRLQAGGRGRDGDRRGDGR